VTLEEWLDHYTRVASLPPDSFVGRLDPALPRVDITPQEKRELMAFLQALSSDYASVWTQAPQDMEGLQPQP
jgi:hypothetical protein